MLRVLVLLNVLDLGVIGTSETPGWAMYSTGCANARASSSNQFFSIDFVAVYSGITIFNDLSLLADAGLVGGRM